MHFCWKFASVLEGSNTGATRVLEGGPLKVHPVFPLGRLGVASPVQPELAARFSLRVCSRAGNFLKFEATNWWGQAFNL